MLGYSGLNFVLLKRISLIHLSNPIAALFNPNMQNPMRCIVEIINISKLLITFGPACAQAGSWFWGLAVENDFWGKKPAIGKTGRRLFPFMLPEKRVGPTI